MAHADVVDGAGVAGVVGEEHQVARGEVAEADAGAGMPLGAAHPRQPHPRRGWRPRPGRSSHRSWGRTPPRRTACPAGSGRRRPPGQAAPEGAPARPRPPAEQLPGGAQAAGAGRACGSRPARPGCGPGPRGPRCSPPPGPRPGRSCGRSWPGHGPPVAWKGTVSRRVAADKYQGKFRCAPRPGVVRNSPGIFRQEELDRVPRSTRGLALGPPDPRAPRRRTMSSRRPISSTRSRRAASR